MSSGIIQLESSSTVTAERIRKRPHRGHSIARAAASQSAKAVDVEHRWTRRRVASLTHDQIKNLCAQRMIEAIRASGLLDSRPLLDSQLNEYESDKLRLLLHLAQHSCRDAS